MPKHASKPAVRAFFGPEAQSYMTSRNVTYVIIIVYLINKVRKFIHGGDGLTAPFYSRSVDDASNKKLIRR